MHTPGLQDEVAAGLSSSSGPAWPAGGELLLLQAVPALFPCSDFAHPVTTPFVVTLAQVCMCACCVCVCVCVRVCVLFPCSDLPRAATTKRALLVSRSHRCVRACVFCPVQRTHPGLLRAHAHAHTHTCTHTAPLLLPGANARGGGQVLDDDRAARQRCCRRRSPRS